MCVRSGAPCAAHARGSVAGQPCGEFVRKSTAQIEREIKVALAEEELGGVGGPFDAYRRLPVDDSRGNPLHSMGAIHADKIGSYWTAPVDLRLADLSSLRPIKQSEERVRSIQLARKAGVALPPIELGVFRDGSAWIVDGNHRLIHARKVGLPSVPVVFTFVGS